MQELRRAWPRVRPPPPCIAVFSVLALAALVMAATGADREGLLPKVASAVQAAGGNMRENKVSRLGGLFAAVMRIETPGHQADAAIKVGCRDTTPTGASPRRSRNTPPLPLPQKALADLGLAVTAERKDPPTRVGDLRKVNVRPLDSDKVWMPSVVHVTLVDGLLSCELATAQ